MTVAERKFRDGKREIPDYVDDLMSGLRTEKMTYEQAIKAMNHDMEARVIDRHVDSMIQRHFAGGGRR